MPPSPTGKDPARPRPDATPGAAETRPPPPAPDDGSLVGDLLSRWRELRAQGQEVSAEDLCGGRPDLLERLRHHLRAAGLLGGGTAGPWGATAGAAQALAAAGPRWDWPTRLEVRILRREAEEALGEHRP